MTDTPDQKMQNGKQAKKTEVIEVRLPFDKKQTFMEACKASEQTASSVLRGAIDLYLLTGKVGAKHSKYRSFSMILTGMILGGALYGLAIMDNSSVAAPNTSTVKNVTLTLGKQTTNWSDDKYAAIRNPLIKLQFTKLDRNADYIVDRSEFGSVKDYHGLVGPLDLSKPIIVAPDSYKVFKVHYDEFSKTPFAMGKCFGNILRTRSTMFAQSFYLIDENRDDKLTLAEYANHPKFPTLKRMEKEFAVLDKNKDGYLSLTETRIKIKKWVAAHDLRGNEQYLNSVDVPDGCIKDFKKLDETDYKNLTIDEEAKKPKNYLIIGFGKLERMYEPHAKGGVSKERFDTLDNDNSGGLSFEEFIVWYL
ncbi:MAG: hypothetical protein JKY60_08795 [Kordiimonadaceae bacterium]|nr:hypothetical protein [Kordiimonadaceae bacterium]